MGSVASTRILLVVCGIVAVTAALLVLRAGPASAQPGSGGTGPSATVPSNVRELWREYPLNPTPPPPATPQPSADQSSTKVDPPPADTWMGHSVGRWEGNTLVVDVTNFNDKTWFDRTGNFHSDALHVVERFTLATPDVIDDLQGGWWKTFVVGVTSQVAWDRIVAGRDLATVRELQQEGLATGDIPSNLFIFFNVLPRPSSAPAP